MQPRSITRQTDEGPPELFLLGITLPIEELAHWQYKTVLTIFPLNLQTITVAFDVVKWRGRGKITKGWGKMLSLIHISEPTRPY